MPGMKTGTRRGRRPFAPDLRMGRLAAGVVALASFIALAFVPSASAARLPTPAEARAIFTAEFSPSSGEPFPGTFTSSTIYSGALVSSADPRFARVGGSVHEAAFETLLTRSSPTSEDWKAVLDLSGGPPECSRVPTSVPRSVVRELTPCTTPTGSIGRTGAGPYAARSPWYFAPATSLRGDPIATRHGDHGTVADAARAFGRPRLKRRDRYSCRARWPHSHLGALVVAGPSSACKGPIVKLDLGRRWYTERGLQVGATVAEARRLYPVARWPQRSGEVTFAEASYPGYSYVGKFDLHQLDFGQAFIARVTGGRIRSFELVDLAGE
jgi:hypothetical protein